MHIEFHSMIIYCLVILYNFYLFLVAHSIIDIDPSSPPHSSTTPTTDKTTPPDSAISLELTIIMLSLLGGVGAITFLVCCFWKLKRPSAAVAPAPRPTPREGANPADAYVVKKKDRHRDRRREANMEMSGSKRWWSYFLAFFTVYACLSAYVWLRHG